MTKQQQQQSSSGTKLQKVHKAGQKRKGKGPAGARSITRGSVIRLGRRAGAKRISKGCYELMHTVLKTFIRNSIRNSIIHTRYGSRMTVSVEDLASAFATQGIQLYGPTVRKI